MTDMTLKDIAETMRGIDIAMLSTKAESGDIASRPMSNNGDVEYDGDSYYFAHGDDKLVGEIERDNHVGLSFAKPAGLITGAPTYVAVAGRAQVVRDKVRFQEHWNADLDRWFEDGIDTPGLVMVKVSAQRIKYWAGAEQTEIVL